MSTQVVADRAARADLHIDSCHSAGLGQVSADVAYKRLAIVNCIFIGPVGAGDRQWLLIDAGVPGSFGPIIKSAGQRFGPRSRPYGILLTHGHFDHVGSLAALAETWDAPVFAHQEEIPFLNGTTSYPPPDPTVGGGLMARMANFYPKRPVNLSSRLVPLTPGEVPGFPDWTWIHTPGHTAGHISLWRHSDRTLVTGDAFITTNQESAYSVAVQKLELHGPPQYFTPDWHAARESVLRLRGLSPEIIVAGHGRAMRGSEMRGALNILANDFDRIAVPKRGRYVNAF